MRCYFSMTSLAASLFGQSVVRWKRFCAQACEKKKGLDCPVRFFWCRQWSHSGWTGPLSGPQKVDRLVNLFFGLWELRRNAALRIPMIRYVVQNNLGTWQFELIHTAAIYVLHFWAKSLAVILVVVINLFMILPFVSLGSLVLLFAFVFALRFVFA